MWKLDAGTPETCEVPEKGLEDGFLQEGKKELSSAALRALAEAAQRRLSQNQKDLPKEVAGRGGLDPVRFGDWEKNGLISDF